MVPAEQDPVPDRRRAVITCPPSDVMDLAECRRAMTARIAAEPVPRDDGPALGPGERSLRSPHVQGLPIRAEHDPRDRAVARDPAEHRARQRLPVVQLGRLDQPTQPCPVAILGRAGEHLAEALPRHVHADVRPHLCPAADPAPVERELRETRQGRGSALIRRPAVVGRGNTHDARQRRDQNVRVLRGEETIERDAVVAPREAQPFLTPRVPVLALMGIGVDPRRPPPALPVELVDAQPLGLGHQRGLVAVREVRSQRCLPGVAGRTPASEYLGMLEGDLPRAHRPRGGGQRRLQRLTQRGLSPRRTDGRPRLPGRPVGERARPARGPPAVVLHACEESCSEREHLVAGGAELSMDGRGLAGLDPGYVTLDQSGGSLTQPNRIRRQTRRHSLAPALVRVPDR